MTGDSRRFASVRAIFWCYHPAIVHIACIFGHNGPERRIGQSGGSDFMRWIAPSEKDTATATLEKRLWDAADQFRANSGLKSQEYSAPVLGLIFLRFAEVRFAAQRAKLEKAGASSRRGSRVDEPAAYHAEGILYLPAEARFDYLLNRPEAEDIGGKVNEAMRDIEKHNPQLAGVLPKTYNLFTSTLLKELLKKVSEIPATRGLRRLRAHLRILPRRVRPHRGPEGRRVLHARAASSGCSPRSSSRITAASSTRRAARAACSCSRRGSWRSTRKTPPPSSPFTASRRPTKPAASAA